MHSKSSVSTAAQTDLHPTNGPELIDPSQFKHVSGGAPKGGWGSDADAAQAPKGGWSDGVEAAGAPKGGW